MTTCPLHDGHEQPCSACGAARVRAALAVAPRPPHAPGDDPGTTTRERALAKAKAERNRRP